MNILPSKRFFVYFSVILLLIVLVYTLKEYKNKEITISDTASYVNTEREISVETKKLIEKDTDKDGLKDWEEILLGTDINNPDTDGDGILDVNEERISKTNEKGLYQKSGNYSIFDIGEKENLSETEILSRSLFSQYLAISNGETNIDPSVAENLAKGVANSVILQIQEESTISPYTENQLNVISDSDTKTDLKQYANSISIPINEAKKSPSEFLALSTFAQTGNPQDIDMIDDVVSSYSEIENTLVSLPVHEQFVSIHLGILNGLALTRRGVKDFSYVKTDPIKVLLAIKNYEAGGNLLDKSIKELRALFIKEGIVFSPTDPAFILVS